MQTKRQIALDWWNSLAIPIQHELFVGYKQFTPAKDHTQLTGREIQNIWAVQTNK